LLNFKGCDPEEHEIEYDEETDISMSQFIESRSEICNEFPEIGLPDFAEANRLPKEARCILDEEDHYDDEWEKHLKDPLSHVSDRRWKECWPHVQALFTGNGNPKNLRLGFKDDLASSIDKRHCKISQGEVTLDIDSVLALFTDLSAIKTLIKVSIVSNPMKNLQRSVHLSHQGISLHHIPHFYLGSFGHDPSYDLFVMLPALHRKNAKRTRGNLHNHVSENVRRAFMMKCFLPAAEYVIRSNLSQGWDYNYDVAKTKSTAAAREANQYSTSKARGLFSQDLVDLDPSQIDDVWRICFRTLRREMKRDENLAAFNGFQFFINAKGFKHRMNADEFGDLMKIYKARVSHGSFLCSNQFHADSCDRVDRKHL
jgi:hypothetical protein